MIKLYTSILKYLKCCVNFHNHKNWKIQQATLFCSAKVSMAIKFSKLLLNIERVQFVNGGNEIDPDKRFVTIDVSGITGVHLS